ncbi:MAG: DUF3488 and transglutaminase-like domain-containing protein [Planctomycetota bacterium]
MTRYDLRCYAAAAVAVLAYSAAAVEFGYGLLVLLGLALAWRISGGRGGSPVPRWAINVLLLGAAVFAGFGLLDGQLDVNDFSRLIGVLLVIKMLDRRGPRDDAQMLALCAFLTVGAVLTSASLLTAGLILVELVLLVPAVLRFQVAAVEHRAFEAARRLGTGTDAGKESRPGLPAVLTFGPEVVSAVKASGRSLLVVAFVLGIIVFLVMPRGLGRSSFGTWGASSAGRVTGFNDEVQLGVGGLISDSPEVVADVQFVDADGRPATGEGEVLYLRGAVLDEYDDGRWVRSQEARERSIEGRIFMPNQPYSITTGRRTGEKLLVTLRAVPRGRSHLFALFRPITVKSDRGQRIIHGREDLQLERVGGAGSVSYEIEVDRFGTDRFVAQNRDLLLDEPRPEELPSFPSDVVGEFARDLLRAEGIEPDAARRAREIDERVVNLFATTLINNYSYTLEVVASTGDPVEWFLTEGRIGHCEYFAAALTALCRSVGIDARVVTGYVATEWNAQTQHYTVRQSNAHAWVEAEVLPGIWKRFDPTPPADFGAIHQPTPTVWSEIRKLIQAVEFAWVTGVVSFDSDTQRSLASLIPGLRDGDRDNAGLMVSPREVARARSERRWTRADALRFLSWAALCSGIVLTFAGVLGLVSRSARVRRLLASFRGRARRGAGFYEGLVSLAAAAGCPRKPGQSPREHALAASDYFGAGRSQALAVADLYYRSVFDPKGLSQTDRARAGELIRELYRLWRPGMRRRMSGEDGS